MSTSLHRSSCDRPDPGVGSSRSGGAGRVSWHAVVTAVLGMLMVLAPAAQAQDLGLSAVVAPVSGCALGSSEPVSIRITNYGPTLQPGSSFLVLYTVDGGSSVNDTVLINTSFQTNTSLVHTFAVPANLAASGDHSFTVSINPNGDINPGNNTVSGYIVHNSAPSVAGTLTGPASGSSGTLTLGASTGNVVQWEESPDNLRWFKLANTTSTQDFADLATTTRFRVRVANAPCAAVLSNVVMVAP